MDLVMSFHRLWASYLRTLNSHPLTTKYVPLRAITGLAVAALGDAISQTIIEKKGLEWKRNAVVGAYGFTETVIEGHYWYGLLDKVFGPRMTFGVSVAKMVADQILFSPLEVSSFMVWTHLLEGQTSPTLAEKLLGDFPPAMLVSYVFWCPASLASFYLVPLHLRALYTCIMCVVWDTFMSFASHNIVKNRLGIGNTE